MFGVFALTFWLGQIPSDFLEGTFTDFIQNLGNRQRKIEPSSPTDMIVLLLGHILARLTSPPCPKPIANTSPSLYFQTLKKKNYLK